MELTEALASYVREKIKGTEKFMVPHDEEEVFVQTEIGKLTNHHHSGDMFRAEANVTVRGKRIRAESSKSDLYAAIDDMRDQLIRELNSAKEKDRTLFRKGAAMIKNMMRFGRDR